MISLIFGVDGESAPCEGLFLFFTQAIITTIRKTWRHVRFSWLFSLLGYFFFIFVFIYSAYFLFFRIIAIDSSSSSKFLPLLDERFGYCNGYDEERDGSAWLVFGRSPVILYERNCCLEIRCGIDNINNQDRHYSTLYRYIHEHFTYLRISSLYLPRVSYDTSVKFNVSVGS